MRYQAWQTEFFVILDHFLPFYPSNNPKNQNFEKMKKTPEDIIILQMCTINDSHMMYGSWEMECNGHNFLSFWTIFYPFTTSPPPNNPNIKILKKMEKLPIILHRCNINDNHMMYGSWDTECVRQNFLPFWTIFALLPP